MAEWSLWLIVAGIVVILELFTGTFYLLMVALGLAAGGAAAFAGGGAAVQLIAAASVGVLSTYLLRRSKFGKINKTDAQHDPNINLDIGQQVTVPAWDAVPEGVPAKARVMYRGAWWDVELAHGAAQPGNFVIKEMRGSRLIVAGSKSQH